MGLSDVTCAKRAYGIGDVEWRGIGREVFAAVLATAAPVHAGDFAAGGKLLLTNGGKSIEGAAGGGLATWAVVTGNETEAGIGGAAHATIVTLPDFEFRTYGAAIGLFDRVELSFARQDFDTGPTGAALGLGHGFTFNQDIWGLKLRVAGDAVHDQDRPWPQLSIGIQHKRNHDGDIARASGAVAATDTDFYVAATKLLLRQSLLLNATLRITRANQGGLLGFGGDRGRGREPQVEASAAYLVSRRLAVGIEYRTKPDQLAFAREDDWADLFAAFALSHNITLTAAYVDLGSIASFRHQRGAFLSLQVGL